MVKKIYNQPTCLVLELRGRDAMLQSISGSRSLDGTESGGKTSEDNIINADVKGVTNVNLWDEEW